MILLIGLIVLFVSLGIVYFLMQNVQKQEIQNEKISSYLSLVEEEEKRQVAAHEQANRFRHDLAKHLRTLEYLQKQWEETGNGAENGMESQKAASFQKELLDAILETAREQCERNQIRFSADIPQEGSWNLSPYDLTGLLTNLLDNAMEAAVIAEDDKRAVAVSVHYMEEATVLRVGNTVDSKEMQDLSSRVLADGTVAFHTRKSDVSSHGIGTKSIDNIVERCHGTIQTRLQPERSWLEREVCIPA